MKIGIIKEKISGLIISTILVLIPAVLILLFVKGTQEKIILSLFCVFIYLILLLNYLISMEWYIIDKNSIKVRNVFGIVNQVEFKNVEYAYIKKLPVYTRDKGITCILFKDNRKENSFFKGYNTDNHKKYIVRIPYNQEFINYLENNNINLNANSIMNVLKWGK